MYYNEVIKTQRGGEIMKLISKNIFMIFVFSFVLLLVGCSNILDDVNENPEDNNNPTNQKAILDFPEEKLRYEFFLISKWVK